MLARCRGFWRAAALFFACICVAAAPTDVPSAASFYVHTLPGLRQDPTHPLHIYAGHLPSDPEAATAPPTAVTAHLYFVLTKARRTADKERVIFWFNGGPGCSSFDGLMMEIGPWRMDKDGNLNVMDGGWEEYAHVVYVDQPAGTGYSYTSTDHYVHELSDASAQVVQFMRQFYRVFPEYREMDTYLAGESYAGQFIPYIADAILNSNLNIPFKGAAIGNGWIDARRQYPAYLDYAVKHGLVEPNSDDYKRAKEVTDACMTELDKITDREPINVDMCERVMLTVLEGRQKDGKCVNVYDVRLTDDVPACGLNWPPDLEYVTPYLGRQDVVQALHATAHAQSWVECRGRVGQELSNRNSQSSITLLPKVTERVEVLLFAGDQDFICNYVGIEGLIQQLEWGGERGLGKVQTQSWSVNGQPAGTWVSSRNLTYAKIFNASHMVGFDVPHVAHDMMLRFMRVNFSALADGTARIPSAVGQEHKPALSVVDEETEPSALPGGKTPEQDKAMWEAYYNAGSAAVVLVLILLALGAFFWCRVRRRRGLRLPNIGLGGTAEESIPLNQTQEDDDFRRRKGKEREVDGDTEERTVFEVGEDEDDEEKSPIPRR
ncbi:alpha/beta-hydrolase [Gloeophyllum trabeum ATCC 11539]|uniref:Carboxypeptidase n=1 Tax=Gloeophyllum trabeum (strain ATCC 11539 / FP-39264 / Madison 617) TaxID=670483 RepID=S7QH02_GLOTA|nr:alpha/beta-hydrolase [Gloeophyllum trabeum ATCC 11539]EPQ59066.1 alpha/beta-hydrolase [Gloeophyllum trabeum ATCC 11539]